MIDETVTLPRTVKDPLYSPVKQFLLNRHKLIKQEGNLVERHLADHRYVDMKQSDFIIESVYTDDDGSKKVCLVKRDKTFARVDLPLTSVSIITLADDFSLPYETCNTLTEFKNKFNQGLVQGKLLKLVWRNSLAYCVKNTEVLDLRKFESLTQDIFFAKTELYRSSETFIDPDDFTSGGVLITDDSVGQVPVYLFVEELVTEELKKIKLEDNFPETFTTQRGNELRFTHKLTVQGVDVTAKSEMIYKSKSGYVVGSQSPSKLESVFNAIRGSQDTVLEDEVEIDISVTHEGYNFTKSVTIRFTVGIDSVSTLTIVPSVTSLTVPSLYDVGIIVKCKEGNNFVNPTSYPDWLTCSLTNDKFFLDKTWTDGLLYIGKPSKIIIDQSFKDLITGEFKFVDKVGKLFVDLEVIKPTQVQETLTLIELSPRTIEGKKNDTGKVNYKVSLKGNELSLTNCNVKPVNIGNKGLFQITTVDNNTFDYKIINDSGTSGSVITENLNLNLRFIDQDGLLYKRSDIIGLSVIKPSVVDLRLRGTFNNKVSKYQKGPLPCQVFINGNERSNEITNIRVKNPESSSVIMSFDPWTLQETWIVVEASNVVTNPKITFIITLPVDGMDEEFEWEQDFEIASYTGSKIAVIPGTKELNGRINDIGSFEICVYNQRERINMSCYFNQQNSNLPIGVSITPIKGSTTRSIEVGYQFNTQGTYQSTIAYSAVQSNPSPDQIGFLVVNSIVKGPEEVIVNLQGEVILESFKAKELTCNLTYLGNNVSLLDPRVTIKTKLSDPRITVTEIKDNSLVLYPDIDQEMNATLTTELELELWFNSPNGLVYKVKEALVKVFRPIVSKTTMRSITDKLIPAIKQPFRFQLLDQTNNPVIHAKLTGFSYVNKNENLPTLLGTSNILVDIDKDNGIYEVDLMASHFGGEFDLTVGVLLGGVSIRSEKTSLNCVSVTPEVSNVTDGIAILNVNSNIDFTVKLDKYLEPNGILNAVLLGNVQFDSSFIHTVNNFVKVNELGNYQINVASTGKIGTTQLRVILTDNDRSWDVIVNIEMKR